MVLSFAGIAQVGDKPAFLTSHEVVLRAILVIAHHRFGGTACVAPVLIDQTQKLAVFRHAPGRCLYRRDHPFLIIDRAVMVIARRDRFDSSSDR